MSRPSTPPIRRPRRLLLALAVAAVGLLAACGQEGSAPDSYGATTQDNFLEGCIDGLTADDREGEALSGDEAEQVCQCTYDGIVEEIPFEDFQEIYDEQREEPQALDERIRAIADRCQQPG